MANAFENRLRALIRQVFGGVWQQEKICVPARSDVVLPHIMGRVPDLVEVGDPVLLDEFLGQQVGGACLPFSHWFGNEELASEALGAGLRRPEGSPLIEAVNVNAAHVRIRNWTVLDQDIGVIIMSRQGLIPPTAVVDEEGLVGVWMDFQGLPRTGAAALNVQFTDLSSYSDQLYGTAWVWVWGDGTPNGNTQNPLHPYANPGTYDVTMTVTFNDGSTHTVTKIGYIVAT